MKRVKVFTYARASVLALSLLVLPITTPLSAQPTPPGPTTRAWKPGLSATIPAYGACWACSASRDLRGCVAPRC